MKLPRRTFLHLVAGAATLPALPRVAWAQVYPSRPVRIVVGFLPGGPNDIHARLIGAWLSEPVLGLSVAVHRSTSFQNNSGLPPGPTGSPGGRLMMR
jgi:tripartite-type tricarboxylate transporter receptor subunit TctC